MGYGADVAEFARDNGIDDLALACEMYNDPGDDGMDYEPYSDDDFGDNGMDFGYSSDDDFGDNGMDFGYSSDNDCGDNASDRFMDSHFSNTVVSTMRRIGGHTYGFGIQRHPAPAASSFVALATTHERARKSMREPTRGQASSSNQQLPKATIKKNRTAHGTKPKPQSERDKKGMSIASPHFEDSERATQAAADVQFSKVVLKDGIGAPIDFGDDETTQQNLLRVMQGIKKWEQNVKMESVKEEVEADDASLDPDDSVSNLGGTFAEVASSSRGVGFVNQVVQARIGARSEASYGSSSTRLTILTASGEIGGNCFLAQHWFPTPEKMLVQASDLAVGRRVQSSDGQSIEVKSITVEVVQEQDVVEIEAGDEDELPSTLTVTSSHRVMVQRGERPQTLQASALKTGDLVYCSGDCLKRITSIKVSLQTIEIADITFFPDLPVEAFCASPPAILRKGTGQPKARRGKHHQTFVPQQHASLTSTALDQLNLQSENEAVSLEHHNETQVEPWPHPREEGLDINAGLDLLSLPDTGHEWSD